MSNPLTVVIVGPDYDNDTAITSAWAGDLYLALQRAGHHTIGLFGSGATANALRRYFPPHVAQPPDALIFYGHGDHDRLYAQATTTWSSVTQNDLLTVNDVALLRGCPVFTACCYALHTLGQTLSAATPSSQFVGYTTAFGISASFAKEFQTVINSWAQKFASQPTASQVGSGLKSDWQQLSSDLLSPSGKLSRQPNSFLAGYAAAVNALFVGGYP